LQTNYTPIKYKMKTTYYFYIFILFFLSCSKKKESVDPIKKETFLNEQKVIGTPIFGYLNKQFFTLHSLNQDDFTKKIDSIKNLFTNHLQKNKSSLFTCLNKSKIVNSHIFSSFKKVYSNTSLK